MLGEDANQEMTMSYYMSQGPGSPRKTEGMFQPGRHRDWTTNSSCTSLPHWENPAEPVWGVTKKIPGMDNEQSNKIVSEQQSR